VIMMKVYIGTWKHPVTGNRVPIAIETDIEWAIKYWTDRKKKNPDIWWEVM